MRVTENPNESDYQHIGFGPALRFHRKRLRIRQAELADALQVAQTTISLWERQDEPISDPFMLWELARLLRTTPDDLRAGVVRMSAPRQPTAEEYIAGLVDSAPDGVDRDVLRRLFEVAAALPPDRLDELVDFGEYQRARSGRGARVHGDNSSDSRKPQEG